jgi:TPR repeat protein
MPYAALIAIGLIVSPSTQTQDAAALQRDCEAGKPLFCRLLGDVYRDRAGAADMARAATFYGLACEGGNGGGCHALASLHMEGTGVPKDPTRAAELFKKGCEDGDGLSCTSLAILYDKGTGVRKDPLRAEALWDRACRQGETFGCLMRDGARRARARAEGKPAGEVCARHILVKVESPGEAGHPEAEARRRAQAVLTSLKAGTDFATLARKFSEEASSASSGGDIGCVQRGVMVPEFEDVAFALKVGETSGVVRTPFGFHVIQRVAKAK